jgi:predicted transcriptional regulator
MVRRKNPTEASARLLTETELELMGILWALGEGTVHDVMSRLPESRKLAYTSVSTILRILEQKQALSSRKAGKGHIYFPRIEKSEYETTSLQHLLHRVFDDTPSALVKRLLEDSRLSEDDLSEIRNLLDQKQTGDE